MWLFQNVFDLVKELLEWYHLQSHPDKLPQDISVQEHKKKQALLCALRAFLDCGLALGKLCSLEENIVGMLGISSTLIGLYQLWTI